MVVNNEIIGYSASYPYGISTSSSVRANLYHNSVLITGTAVARGLNVSHNASTQITAKNNIFAVMTSTADYPVYLGSTQTVWTNYDFDYNLYYSKTGTYVGYAGGNKTSLPLFTNSDANSVVRSVYFTDASQSLLPASVYDMDCPKLTGIVDLDIDGNPRPASTIMGAYQFDNPALDVLPASFTLSVAQAQVGTPVSMNVTLYNAGTTTIDTVNIYWKANGTTTSVPYGWKGELKSDTVSSVITIGDFNPIEGDNDIVVWTSMPNTTVDNNVVNDTIRTSVYACDTMMNGTYRIGPGGHYEDIESAITVLNKCGMNGAITFAFIQGDHTAYINMAALAAASESNSITFTSESGDASNTILYAKPSNNLMTFASAKYLTVTNLTLNARAGNHALQITGTNNDNIEIANNIILLDTIATSGRNGITIGYGVSTNNVRIVNNKINGGTTGIDIQGTGKNRICDSNIIANTRDAGIYWRYGSAKSISHNVITSRSSNYATSWYGIRIGSSTNDTCHLINGNTIRTLTRKMTGTVRGFDFQGSKGNMIISNNDILLYGLGSNVSGVYLSNTNIDLVSNSIYVEGVGGTAINFSTLSLTAKMNAQNNIAIAGGTGDNIIYISSSALNFLTSDYNNFHSAGNIAAGYPELNDWQTGTGKDLNSVSYLPAFTDTSKNLAYIPSSLFHAPVSLSALTDFNGNIRTTPTLMGAYDVQTRNLDLELSAILDVPVKVYEKGETLNPRLVIRNSGATNLDSAKICYNHNGIEKFVSLPNTPLRSNEIDTLNLDPINLGTGEHQISLYVTTVNDMVSDNNQQNDTLRVNFHVCDSLYYGPYTVGGSSADFTKIMDAIDAFHYCGVSGDITLVLQDGTYPENVELTRLYSIFGNYKLNITSENGIAEDVIIRPASGTAVKISHSRNITLDKITIDATTSNSYGLVFVDTCLNITVTNCHFLSDTLSSRSNNECIIKVQSPDRVDYLNNVLIENNIVCGGRHGIRLVSTTLATGTGTATGIVKIKNNLVYNQYETAIYLAASSSSSEVSFNKVISRISTSNTDTTWVGITASDPIPVTGNKIRHRDMNRKNMTGIYIYGNTALVSNNEIMGHATNQAIGIYSGSGNIRFNSIYLTGSALQIGVDISASSMFNVLNNNIVLESNLGYPINISQNDAITVTRNINQNNYYAPVFIGKLTLTNNYGRPNIMTEYRTLDVWKMDIFLDVSSVTIEPEFVDISQSMELENFAGLHCLRDATVPNDINNTPRTNPTTIGAYGFLVSADYDLALVQIVDPTNDVSNLCAPDYVNVRYAIQNTGTEIGRFADDTLYLHLIVDGEKGIVDTTVLITTDSLSVFQTKTFDVTDFIDVSFSGDYHITAWISSDRDTNYLNDTLRMTYRTNKIALPYDEDFSTSDMPSLVVENIAGTNGWHVEQGGNHIIAPDYGTGMLVMDGSSGTISNLKIGQIELERTASPKLEFWYAHDNNEHQKRDQMLVKVSWNGGTSENLIYEIMRYDASYTTPGWKKYTVDLSPYVDSACVVVSLETYSYGGTQLIDRIAITSSQDIALREMILTPDLDVCHIKNKAIKLVVSNQTAQPIDFTETPADIYISISGNGIQKDTVWEFSGIMGDEQIDTLDIFSGLDFHKGSYDFIAYIRTSLADSNKLNDTIKETIEINPKFEFTIETISTQGDPAAVGIEYKQKITITNIGNVELPDLEFVLSVDTAQGKTYFTRTNTLGESLLPNETKSFEFDLAYAVPRTYEYSVTVHGYLLCDPTLCDTTFSVQEYADLEDLALIEIVEPIDDQTTDIVGREMEVSIKIENLSPLTAYGPGDVLVGYMITDLDGNRQGNFINGEIEEQIATGATVSYTFDTEYAVPPLAEYYLVVYIEKKDKYQQNDTLRMRRQTNHVAISNLKEISFTMEQNFPNPAKNKTIINYNIPQDGEITFAVYSVNGQLLYSQRENATSGDNQIELDISDYASGIYFYTMEYKGQRIVKRMGIKR
jgi:hypothetical protein